MSFPVTTRGPQTAADWTAANPILDQFEVGIEINPATGAYERAKLGDGRTAWADLAYWNPSGGPKVYRALLTQTGTNAPVATVLENTLGGTVVWTYSTDGTYIGTLAGAFPEGKVSQWSGICGVGDHPTRIYTVSRDASDDEIVALSFANEVLSDGRLINNYVQIFVNP